VLRTLPDDVPAVLVPAFLSSGYHVRVDIPGHVAASGHRNAMVTTTMGPAQDTVRVVVERLLESGWQPFDSVVLAAAGTSDPNAQRDLRVTAALLSAALGPRGARRVVVASYLLADGLFQDRLRASGADVVAEPLGTHPGVVRLIASRFRRAVLPVAA
jgi:sirohydrochlorin ferrochelatase